MGPGMATSTAAAACPDVHQHVPGVLGLLAFALPGQPSVRDWCVSFLRRRPLMARPSSERLQQRDMPNCLGDLHIQSHKPPEQEVVIELLHQIRSLRMV